MKRKHIIVYILFFIPILGFSQTNDSKIDFGNGKSIVADEIFKTIYSSDIIVNDFESKYNRIDRYLDTIVFVSNIPIKDTTISFFEIAIWNDKEIKYEDIHRYGRFVYDTVMYNKLISFTDKSKNWIKKNKYENYVICIINANDDIYNFNMINILDKEIGVFHLINENDEFIITDYIIHYP